MSSALADFRITGIIGFAHTTQRRKFIGRNAKKDVHGAQATEPVVRIYTDKGLDGIGFGRVSEIDARALLGRSLDEIWMPEHGMVSSLGRADHAIYDLIGKALQTPAWRLMGGAGPEAVSVYDTTLYFSDLLPEHLSRGVARIVDEMEYSLAQGYRAFKVKVGRGARWMESDAGLARDIEVVRVLAKAAPSGTQFMADANDQYGLETARRFLGEVGEHLSFLEEPFPESQSDGRALRRWIADSGLPTLIADGETEHNPDTLYALGLNGALDILQPDIRALGLSLQRRLARDLSPHPELALAPHCWGSFLGTYKMLQLARGVTGILTCEIDPMESDLFDVSEWRLQDGKIFVPDRSGAGLEVREDIFQNKYLPAAWRVGKVP